MNGKKPWLSKTLWINLITATVAFIPTVGQYISSHPELFVVVFAIVNGILRLVSKKEIEIV